MGMQIHSIQYNLSLDKLLFSPSLLPAKLNNKSNKFGGFDPLVKKNKAKWKVVTVSAAASSSGSVPAAPLWDTWSPDKATPSPSLSDVLWPSLGAFAGMALLGKMDQLLAPIGLSMTIAPLGAVCAVLFISPKAPAARKYNMFMAQIGCAALGVLAYTILGPGWLARGAALSASLAFMIYTKSTHPPAASLPLLFIDGAKLHGLNYWYALFPGAAGCLLLSVLQEIVYYLKENFKF
ncbi:uncharacterized protein LOC130798334 [Amaranthus tricolor]|uniref:uncharacterized protein LOC130798334 n=1 Tax=Amaranthus tricolor TaxID=29722 RepID=UPI00258603E9|nr:uncharacterized protein LOC130798334 [Amaranthus tricolor]